jgi:IS30 family transposase
VKCKKGNVCTRYCTDYTKSYCEETQRFPFTCNHCTKKAYCSYDKTIYDAYAADKAYRSRLADSRTGYYLTGAELLKIDSLASPMIKNGLSPYHVIQTYGDEIPCSESTLRKLLRDGELEARQLDLQKGTTYKTRKRPKRRHDGKQRASDAKQGHLHTDFLAFMQTYDGIVVEMDCVEGTKSDKAALLTLEWAPAHMQIAIIMDEQTCVEVVAALDKLEITLGKNLFQRMFPLILTDNGHEFADVKSMERSVYGGKRTQVFFCEPNRSDQKAECECAHKFIRYVIPKGTSLEPFHQGDINLMMNHINSYKRKKIGGKSPYEMARFLYGETFDEFFLLLGLEEIPPQDIILRPTLLSAT